MRQNDRKFIPTDARDDIFLTETILQDIGDILQCDIARLVPKLIVDLFQVVHVADYNRNRADAAFLQARQFLIKKHTVIEAGHHVVQADVGHALFSLLAVGNIHA